MKAATQSGQYYMSAEDVLVLPMTLTKTRRLQQKRKKSVSSVVSHTYQPAVERTLRATHTLLNLPYLVNCNKTNVKG